MLTATSCVSNEGGGYDERSLTFAKVTQAHHRRHLNQSSRHTTAQWTQRPAPTRLRREELEEFPQADASLQNSPSSTPSPLLHCHVMTV